MHHLYGISSRPSKPTTNPRAAAHQQSLQSPQKSSFLPLCSLHPHLPLFLFNPDKGNVSDKRALPPLERDRAPACVKRRSGSNLSSRLISHGKPILPGPSSGSPAHKGTLSPLNDKQFCDAGAGKRIRQVQGSLENRCVRGAAIWGQVNSWGEQTRNANNRLGGSWGRWGGCSTLCPSFPVLPPHTRGSSSVSRDCFSQKT